MRVRNPNQTSEAPKYKHPIETERSLLEIVVVICYDYDDPQLQVFPRYLE